MGEAVFHLVDSLAVGGAERMAVDVSNGLARRGWQVHLFASRSLGPLSEDLDDAVSLHDLARRSRWDLSGLLRLRRAVHEVRPALVHAHGWSSLQLATACLSGVHRGPALVFHDHRPAGLAPVGWRVRASAWPLTRAHVAVDQALLDPGLRTRRRAVRALVPNGIPLDRFALKTTYEVTGEARLVALANLRPAKDHPLLFDAIARLVGWGIETRTDLIGATEDHDHRALCEDVLETTGLTDRVAVLGPRSDVATTLAGYDAGVLSSHTESGPIALVEYMAAGLPFVATDVGQVPASLPDDLRRWVVPAGDAGALAGRLRALLELPVEERRRLGVAGATFVRDHFSIERTISSLEDVYRRIALT